MELIDNLHNWLRRNKTAPDNHQKNSQESNIQDVMEMRMAKEMRVFQVGPID